MIALSDKAILEQLNRLLDSPMSNAYAPLSRSDDVPNGTHIQIKRLPGGGIVTKLDTDGDYSYSYGENGLYDGFSLSVYSHRSYNEGVRGLLHGRYALASAVFCSLGGLTFGYDQGVISNVRYD